MASAPPRQAFEFASSQDQTERLIPSSCATPSADFDEDPKSTLKDEMSCASVEETDWEHVENVLPHNLGSLEITSSSSREYPLVRDLERSSDSSTDLSSQNSGDRPQRQQRNNSFEHQQHHQSRRPNSSSSRAHHWLIGLVFSTRKSFQNFQVSSISSRSSQQKPKVLRGRCKRIILAASLALLLMASLAFMVSVLKQSKDAVNTDEANPIGESDQSESMKDTSAATVASDRSKVSDPTESSSTFISTNPTTIATDANAKPSKSITKGGSNEEPNPPNLPESIKLFFPPKSQDEIKSIQKILNQYSDPILTREDYLSRTSNDTTLKDNSSESSNLPGYTYTSKNHFSPQRTALLFAPGTYPLSFQVGYYTSVLGLGNLPTDVTFTNSATSDNGIGNSGNACGPFVEALDKFTNRPPNGSGLNTFWRSVENIAIDANVDGNRDGASSGMHWTVSQAAPLRRMHIRGDLNLYDSDSWVSGGFASNLIVDGTINFGGQQQWVMRNVDLRGGGVNGAWSLVFVGCTGMVPEERSGLSESGGGASVTVEKFARVKVEKPFIALRPKSGAINGKRITDQERGSIGESNSIDSHEFVLRVPSATFGKSTSGPQFDSDLEDIRDFRNVKLGVPSNATDLIQAALENHINLQSALDEGKDLVLSPGIYPLSSSLEVGHPNQVILGLGYATLLAPANGTPCIYILPKIPGVRIAGIMLEASVLSDPILQEPSLLQWGDSTVDDPGDELNPGVLSDVFARVGGASLSRNVSTDVMVQLHSGNVYGDNLWLWRADHVQLRPHELANFPQISPLYRQTIKGECEAKNGLIVNGSNVTIVGLAVEHTSEDQTVWNGEDGLTYFYQCELPYDVDHSFAEHGFVGYKVGAQVRRHEAFGLGIYSNFRDFDVEVSTAIIHPTHSGLQGNPSSDKNATNIQMKNTFTVLLDNQGRINSVVNGKGPGPEHAIKERGRPFRCIDEDCL